MCLSFQTAPHNCSFNRRYMYPIRTNFQHMMAYLSDIGQIEFDILDSSYNHLGQVKVPMNFHSGPVKNKQNLHKLSDNMIEGKYSIWDMQNAESMVIGSFHLLLFLEFGEHSLLCQRLVKSNHTDKKVLTKAKEASPVMSSFQLLEAQAAADAHDSLPLFPKHKPLNASNIVSHILKKHGEIHPPGQCELEHNDKPVVLVSEMNDKDKNNSSVSIPESNDVEEVKSIEPTEIQESRSVDMSDDLFVKLLNRGLQLRDNIDSVLDANGSVPNKRQNYPCTTKHIPSSENEALLDYELDADDLDAFDSSTLEALIQVVGPAPLSITNPILAKVKLLFKFMMREYFVLNSSYFVTHFHVNRWIMREPKPYLQ
jgi:hypothetical protein